MKFNWNFLVASPFKVMINELSPILNSKISVFFAFFRILKNLVQEHHIDIHQRMFYLDQVL